MKLLFATLLILLRSGTKTAGSGNGEIRTPGPFQIVSLANWWYKPLTHISKESKEYFEQNNYGASTNFAT